MNGPFQPINPGQTFNMFDGDHLTQVQHKGDHVDIVDHFDHQEPPLSVHIVTSVDGQGNIDTNID